MASLSARSFCASLSLVFEGASNIGLTGTASSRVSSPRSSSTSLFRLADLASWSLECLWDNQDWVRSKHTARNSAAASAHVPHDGSHWRERPHAIFRFSAIAAGRSSINGRLIVCFTFPSNLSLALTRSEAFSPEASNAAAALSEVGALLYSCAAIWLKCSKVCLQTGHTCKCSANR